MTEGVRLRGHVAAALISIFMFAPIFYMAFDRDNPVERIRGEVLPHDPARGSEVLVEWTTNAHRWCPGTVFRQIEDSAGTVWLLAPRPTSYEEFQSVLHRSFTLPAGMSCGPAKYRAATEFVCNMVQRLWPIVSRGPEVNFNVVGCPPR